MENQSKFKLVVLLEIGSKVLSRRLEVFCNQNQLSFEQFLTRIRHDVYHMWQISKCCQCKSSPLATKPSLFKKQFDKLYQFVAQPVPGHQKKGSQECSCHILPREGIKPTDLDISLIVPLLMTFCDLEDWEKNSVLEFRRQRNEIVHTLFAKLNKDNFKDISTNVVIEVLSIAKACDQQFHSETVKELKDLESKPKTESLSEEQIQLVKKHYVSSKFLFEKLHDAQEMISKECRKIPELLEDVIQITEHVHPGVANELRQICTLLGKQALPRRTEVQKHFGQCLRQLKQLFPGITDNGFYEEFGNEDSIQDVDTLQQTSVRDNNMACTNSEIDTHKGSLYIPVRAVDEAEKMLSESGLVNFVGMTGSGKSSNAFELLHRARNGNVFKEKHDILHLTNVDDWDYLINSHKHTLVFIEDPLGRTTANASLIQNDGGIFKKIWSCIENGHVKVIVTIRSNIIQEFADELGGYELFNSKYTIDLSRGEMKMSADERRNLITKYCAYYQITIVKSKSDENIETGDIFKHHRLKISKSTIQKMTKIEPPIGFPLCLRNFFRNKFNINLGLRYFKQPTEALRRQIEALARNKNPIECCQFVILVYALLNGGHVHYQDLTSERFRQFGDDFGLQHIFVIDEALKKLKQKSFMICTVDAKSYRYSHDTVLEAVFYVYSCARPDRLDHLIREADPRIIFELLRTDGYEKKVNEEILKIPRQLDIVLIERFIKELRNKCLKNVLLHPAFKDDIFKLAFFKELKKSENRDVTKVQDEFGHSLFRLSCLFNKYAFVDIILQVAEISQEEVLEGLQTCFTFQYVHTVKSLLPYISKEEIDVALVKSSCQCNDELIHVFLNFLENMQGNGQTFSDNALQRAFCNLCYHGKLCAMKTLLYKRKDLSPKLAECGFPVLCETNNTQAVGFLLDEISISQDQLKEWIISSCQKLSDDMLEFLFSSYIKEQYPFALNLFKYVCISGNVTGAAWLSSQEFLSSEDITKCLVHVCDIDTCTSTTENIDLSKVNNYRKNADKDLPRIRSKSNEIGRKIKSRPNYYRIRSISDSEFKAEEIPVTSESDKEEKSEQFAPDDKQFSRVLHEILSTRPEIEPECLHILILCMCKCGKDECLKVLLKERNSISDKCIAEGMRVASNNRHVSTVQVILGKCSITSSAIDVVLAEACEEGNIEIISAILKKHGSSQLKLIEHLENAVTANNTSTILAILQEKTFLPANVLSQMFKSVCKSNNIDVLNIILNNRPRDIHSQTIQFSFLKACEDEQLNILHHLLKNCHDIIGQHVIEGLFLACRLNKSEVVNIILAEVRVEILTLTEILIIACLKDSVETIHTIRQFRKTLPVKYLTQVAIACFYSRLSLIELIEAFNEENESWSNIYTTQDANVLKGSELFHLPLQLSREISSDTNSEHFKILHILICRAECFTVKHILRHAPYVSDWYISEVLKCACLHNNHTTVRATLEINPDLSVDNIMRGIYQAFESNSLECIEYILGTRKDVPEDNLESGYVMACLQSNKNMVETILRMRNDLSQDFIYKGLTTAVVNKKVEIVQVILNERLDISEEMVSKLYQKACEINNTLIQTLLINYKRGSGLPYKGRVDSFLENCLYNNAEAVKTIMQSRSIPYSEVVRGFTTACRWNNKDTIEAILEVTKLKDKDIKFPINSLCFVGKVGTIFAVLKHRTDLTDFVFLKCCQYGRAKVVRKIVCKIRTNRIKLIHKGIDIACECRKINILSAILKSIDVEWVDVKRHILRICKNGHCNLAEYFLKSENRVPIDVIEDCFVSACSDGNSNIVDIILEERSDVPQETVETQLEVACEHRRLDIFKVIFESVVLSKQLISKLLNRSFGVNSRELVCYILRKSNQLEPTDFYAGLVWLIMNNYCDLSDILISRLQCDSKYLKAVLLRAYYDDNEIIMTKILEAFKNLSQAHLKQLFRLACLQGKTTFVKLILRNHPRFSTKYLTEIILLNLDKGNTMIIDAILKSNFCFSEKQILLVLNKAMECERFEIVENVVTLKQLPLKRILHVVDKARTNRKSYLYGTIFHAKPGISNEHVIQRICKACEINDVELVTSLLRNKQCLSKAECVKLIVKASRCNNDMLFRQLLVNFPEINKNDIYIFGKASKPTISKTIASFERLQQHSFGGKLRDQMVTAYNWMHHLF